MSHSDANRPDDGAMSRQGYAWPIGYMLLSTWVFVGMNGFIKFLGPRYPVSEIIFCRSLFAFLPLLIILFRAGGLPSLRTNQPWNHIRRSIAGVLSMALGFQAMTMLPLSNATAIGFVTPLFTAILAVPLLKEVVGPARWAAIIVGLFGVVLMVPLESGGSPWGTVLGLTATLFSALATIEIRRLGATESGIAIVIYFMTTTLCLSALTLPFVGRWPSGLDFAAMVAMGALGGVGQICITQSYRMMPVSVATPFNYCQLLWAILLDFLAWGHIPGWLVLAGAAIVASSSLFIFWRERRHDRLSGR